MNGTGGTNWNVGSRAVAAAAATRTGEAGTIVTKLGALATIRYHAGLALTRNNSEHGHAFSKNENNEKKTKIRKALPKR